MEGYHAQSRYTGWGTLVLPQLDMVDFVDSPPWEAMDGELSRGSRGEKGETIVGM